MTSDNHHSSHEPWHALPAGFTEYLGLEAKLSIPMRNAILEQATLALKATPSTIVDLGSGTGADAVALAQHFPSARVHALDVSAELLDRVASAASAAGVAERVEGHLVDLNNDWPAEIPQSADLAWASLTLHHVSNPAAVLQRVFDALRPGGVFVLTELSGEETLDFGSGRTDLQERITHASSTHDTHANADWAKLLADAGFLSAERSEHEFLARGDNSDGTRYLELQLRAKREKLVDELTEEDLATLNTAIEKLETGASEVSFRAGRTVWVAVRPERDTPVKVIEADAVVLGGGPAGLAASIALARSRRKVVVMDEGKPRNAPAEGAHNVLGNEGISPLELLARGRAEAESYGVQIVPGSVTRVSGTIDDFTVDGGGGTHRVHARRIILATGLVDDLPDIPGIEEGWGHTVLHCPFCHGWEVRDQRIGIVSRDEVAIHQVLLFSQLSNRVTVFLHDAADPSEEQREQLAALNVEVVRPRVQRLVMDDTQVRAIEVEGDRLFDLDAVVIVPRFNARTGLYEMLGGAAEESPFGTHIPADPRGMTNVPGVWAAGNANQPMAMVVASAASGVTTGAAVHGDLAMADLTQSVQARRIGT
uniref:FAD-dependent oxidoreductase n=1 Tax=Microbacterium sp. TaxID=51671 RepID=UPI003F996BBE